MRPDDLREFTRKQPFEPYRIQIAGGQTYDIYHPDQVIVLRSRVVISVGGENDIPDQVEPVALIQVVHLEEPESEQFTERMYLVRAFVIRQLF